MTYIENMEKKTYCSNGHITHLLVSGTPTKDKLENIKSIEGRARGICHICGVVCDINGIIPIIN